MKRLAETLLKTACANRAATVASRVDSALLVVLGSYCLFPSFEDAQRWRGLNAIGHSTGQRVAVMHPLGILLFIETSTAATLWVGSSATDKLCATLRNPARSHHPVFPEWRRSSAHLQAAAAMRTTLTCQSCVPVQKEKEGRVAEAVAAAPGEREKEGAAPI